MVTLVYLFKMHCDLHSFILKDTTVINSFILGHDSHNIHSSDFILRHPLYFDNDLGCIGQGRVEPMMLRMVRGGHLQTSGGCLWKSRMRWAFGVADVALGLALLAPRVVAVIRL